jgi:hypothetical protein
MPDAINPPLPTFRFASERALFLAKAVLEIGKTHPALSRNVPLYPALAFL